MLNENLAKWAGWNLISHDWSDSGWGHGWENPQGSNIFRNPPDYEHSRDLIARDLLPRLAGIPGAKVSLAYALRDRQEEAMSSWEFAWYLLTLPPADLAAAIWEVVKK